MRKLFPIFLLFVAACIDPLQVNVQDVEKRLIVDGIITDQPGPYQVKLFYSNKLGTSILIPFEAAKEARVAIVDDLGNETALHETVAGTYETNAEDLTGVAGRSYWISITTKNGKSYQSRPQKLTSGGEISRVYFEFVKDGLPGNFTNEYIDALRVFTDAKGDPENENLFRWRWTTIFKATANPELRTRSTPRGDIPIPEPCSGYIYTSNRLIQVGPCTCCICWSYNYSSAVRVSKKDLVTDYVFNRQDLGKIPITGMHFYDRYFIEVQQLSLSEEAYDYWNLVEKQQSGSTDIFQPNAIKIKGNIECLSDPQEEVLGFFGVSGVANRTLYIEESEIPVPIPAIEVVPYSCTSYFFNSTTVKPWFW